MLSTVSETAVMTLKARVIESRKQNGILSDPKGEVCYERIIERLDETIRKRIIDSRLPKTVQNYIVLRARRYDQYVQQFMSEHPEGLVVNLGCGFDTRFWRTDLNPAQYVEIDLPEVVELKKELLGERIKYPMIGSSVLDMEWMDEVDRIRKGPKLFLAEGLMMYLPEEEAVLLMQEIANRFHGSEFVFEIIQKKYTRGIYKKLVALKMKRALHSDAGTQMNFGVTGPEEVESIDWNLKVVEEWSYLEEPEVSPAIQRLFKGIKAFTRAQWTMKALIH